MPNTTRAAQPNGRHSRILLLGIVMLAALVAALTAAIVSAAAGSSVPGVLAASGVTFTAAVTIGFTTCQFLDL